MLPESYIPDGTIKICQLEALMKVCELARRLDLKIESLATGDIKQELLKLSDPYEINNVIVGTEDILVVKRLLELIYAVVTSSKWRHEEQPDSSTEQKTNFTLSDLQCLASLSRIAITKFGLCVAVRDEAALDSAGAEIRLTSTKDSSVWERFPASKLSLIARIFDIAKGSVADLNKQ